MDESDDSKIRRNLVVFSTLMLLVAWMQIPVGEISAGLLKLDKLEKPLHLSQFRLWIACFSALLYLTLRYRFTKEWKELGNTYRTNVRDKSHLLEDKRILKDVALFARTKKDDGGYKGQLFTFYNATLALRKQRFGDGIGDPQIVIGWQSSGHSMTNGTVTILLQWDQEKLGSTAQEAKNLPFEFDRLDVRWMRFYANAYTLVYSPSSVQYIIPIALTAVAFVVVLFKLVQSF
ncbi:MAG: hypothetical protein WA174_13940 [Rhodoferax sp.]